jgi:hypothetical protein
MRLRADQYRRKADRAREFAQQARDPFIKISYQELARDWAALAEQAEWFDSQQHRAIRGPAIGWPTQDGSGGGGRPSVG